MAADAVVVPDGKRAGRVTLATTLVSLLPPVAACLVVVVCFLLGVFSADAAANLILGILATAGLTTSGVFLAGKNTPTDQRATHVVAGEQPEVLPVDAPVPPVETQGRHAVVDSATPDAEDADSDLAALRVPEPGTSL